jgi:hypothetical protein
LVEHEYERLGAVTYLDAWDVRHGKVMGRTERMQAGLTRPRFTTRSSNAKCSAPTTSPTPRKIARTLNEFEHHYNQIAQPFDWTFSRQDLADLLDRLDQRQRDPPVALAA